ncbi:MAG: ribonuclease, partial [Hyphomicrobiales bacterium]|nr:ribonuclease [Hyphomicrobiales bacterium]
MANKMLIDTTHPEETRVVVLRGNRVEEFDFESANRRQLRGNIYLAKVTRVEPSLQAAFVDYGGNRHGFLAFSEIHPDYYQIPVADRQALIADEERAHREAEEEVDRRASGGGRGRRPRREHSRRDPIRTQPLEASAEHEGAPAEGAEGVTPVTDESGTADHPDTHQAEAQDAGHVAAPEAHAEHVEPAREAEAPPVEQQAEATQTEPAAAHEQVPVADPTSDAALQTAPEPTESSLATESPDLAPEAPHGDESAGNGNITEIEEPAAAENGEEEEVVESVGGADAMEEAQERTPRYRRNYKIQEVIKRRQIMLVQVVKEERGTKGAALTTYLSLAGRYSVLMPNTARGGGISRKITNSI